MSQAREKIVQYLNEAHSTEQASARALQSQIAIAPRGSFRKALESHLRETHEHADRLESRLSELDGGGGPLGAGVGLLESAVGQAVSLGKLPLDLIRGTGGEEKVLKDAKDAYALEAREIATYTAVERLATSVDDIRTARLAASILEDEQKMLDRLLKEIPQLTDAVVEAEVGDNPTYALSEIGAVDAARSAAESLRDGAKETASRTGSSVRRTARTARKIPGVAQAEGQIKGAVASESDLPIAHYGDLTASEVVARLSDLSQVDLAKVDSFERRHENRSTILSRITALRGSEPWPGYDELTVAEVRAALDPADEDRIKRVRTYERSHKSRAGVLEAIDHELSAS